MLGARPIPFAISATPLPSLRGMGVGKNAGILDLEYLDGRHNHK